MKIFQKKISSSLPWDQNTFLGWVGEQIFTGMWCFAYMVVIMSITSFFISLGAFYRAYLRYFRALIVEINEVARTQKFRSKKLLGEMIEFHNSVKE